MPTPGITTNGAIIAGTLADTIVDVVAEEGIVGHSNLGLQAN